MPYTDFATIQLILNSSADAKEIENKMKEIYTAAVDVYAAVQRPGKKYLMDFYIMHFVTSVYFIRILLPMLTLEWQAKFLRAYFAKMAQWFVSGGSPKVDRSAVYNHKSSLPQMENPWYPVWDMGIKNMDLHVVKVVRALSKADELYAPDGDNYFLKAAQMTVESTIHGDPLTHNAWSRKPPGFDESWE